MLSPICKISSNTIFRTFDEQYLYTGDSGVLFGLSNASVVSFLYIVVLCSLNEVVASKIHKEIQFAIHLLSKSKLVTVESYSEVLVFNLVIMVS